MGKSSKSLFIDLDVHKDTIAVAHGAAERSCTRAVKTWGCTPWWKRLRPARVDFFALYDEAGLQG
jgi:hypothetical protein